MSIIVRGGTSGVLADVDADKNLAVNLPMDEAKAGFAAVTSEVDAGAISGSALRRSPETNNDYAFRTAVDFLTFEDKFVGTALNSGLWYVDRATMAVAVANAFCTLNSAGSTAASVYAQIKGYLLTPTLGSASTYAQFRLQTLEGGAANKVMEAGLGFASGSADPTDGVYFRWGTGGTLEAVLNNSGNEITASIADLPGNLETHYYIIVLTQDSAEFWIDNVLQAQLSAPVGANRPVRSASLPMFFRVRNIGVTTVAARLLVSDVQMFQGGPDMGADLSQQMTAIGGQSNQGQTGFAALGTQSNITNSMAVTSGTLSNTAAPTGGYTGTTLGGRFQFAALAGAATDLIVFAYQVPTATAGGGAKSLFVTDLMISTVNLGAAVAITPTVLAWTLGFGSSAVSLATADGDTTKAPRRVPLGIQSFLVAAGVGQMADPISMSFASPIVVWPGQFVHIIVQVPVGTATGGQLVNGMVLVNGFWR